MTSTFIQAIAIIFPMIFSANLIMSLVKALAQGSLGNTGLRILLIIISIVGILTVSAITGDPVNMDSISSLSQMLLEAIIVTVGAHFSYKAIKQA